MSPALCRIGCKWRAKNVSETNTSYQQSFYFSEKEKSLLLAGFRLGEAHGTVGSVYLCRHGSAIGVTVDVDVLASLPFYRC